MREIFIKIPNKCVYLTVLFLYCAGFILMSLLFGCFHSGQPRADFSDLQDPFDTPDFNKLYRGSIRFSVL